VEVVEEYCEKAFGVEVCMVGGSCSLSWSLSLGHNHVKVSIVGCDLGVNMDVVGNVVNDIEVVENIDVVDIVVVGDIEVVGGDMVVVDFERRFDHEEASFVVYNTSYLVKYIKEAWSFLHINQSSRVKTF